MNGIKHSVENAATRDRKRSKHPILFGSIVAVERLGCNIGGYCFQEFWRRDENAGSLPRWLSGDAQREMPRTHG
jgi:uncharacterized Fe-S cluster-containing radical SAM superfamily protein